ncbi:alcohol dehydrogenase [acceptor]-like [Onthophagus taurus]|uniref:alcohol dehydrogenase [acceptor]-like n=1 Tax=Onthophagus taurus TaxID=166361 RepID=UPI0039BDCC1A
MCGKIAFATLYCALLLNFSTYICLLDWYEFFTTLSLIDLNKEYKFDYIIVGGGTAGSILAFRLSQNPNNKVLLLEAGSMGKSSILDIPLITPLLHKSIYDWKYRTVPQDNACWAFKDNSSSWPSGKVLGGSGRLNHMLYTRGHPDDYKEWFIDCDCDFNYEQEILYYMKKSENQVGSQSNNEYYHGRGGTLIVDDMVYQSELYDSIFNAANCLNLPIRDVNGKFSSGFSPIQINIKNGKRFTPIHHLLQNQQPNLVIKTQSTAKEILLNANLEAYGVNFIKSGDKYDVFASKGVIISSGTIGSPKLLMLSGIGPKKHLQSIGIKSKLDLPVGYNLQDHISTGFDLIIFEEPLDFHKKFVSPLEVLKYILKENGILTSVGVEVLAFLNTFCLENVIGYDLCEAEFNHRPNIEFLFMQAGLATDYGMRMRHIVGLKSVVWKEYYSKFVNNYTASFLPILLRPKSRGYVKLKNSKIDSKPIINPNYLSEKDDINILLAGIRFIKKLVETPPMRKIGARFNREIFPFCKTFTFDSDDYWKCYIKYMSFTIYHPVGTCKMGSFSDESAVVTRDFKVKGAKKLYVVDASVIPKLISANTNAAVAMIAEKAADSIKMSEVSSKKMCKAQPICN